MNNIKGGCDIREDGTGGVYTNGMLSRNYKISNQLSSCNNRCYRLDEFVKNNHHRNRMVLSKLIYNSTGPRVLHKKGSISYGLSLIAGDLLSAPNYYPWCISWIKNMIN